MSISFARTDTSVVGRWWWTVDRWMLLAITLLLAYGAILTLAASPAAAARIKIDPMILIRQQLILMPVALAIMFVISLLEPKWVRRVAVIGFGIALLATVATLFFADEVKGARRWISLAGFNLQPSEFLKPTLAICAAWMCAHARLDDGFPGRLIATGIAGVAICVLVLQPDIGMAAVTGAIWFSILFLAGLPLVWIAAFILTAAGGILLAYHTLPHVAARVNLFLDPTTGDNFQVRKSLDAFREGGLFGKGPGEGTVKAQLPDAHSDFIFAVAGEEFGLIACLLIVGTYAFIVLRGLSRAFNENNLFVLYATAGLMAGFGLQALINMASALNLIPTKGMTLPLISYGGSSLFALAIGLGMVLALTRKRAGGAA
jgi:cell division protein FtsW